MKQLITLAAALALAISTSAFASTHKEAPGMAASGPMAGGAMSNCDAKAMEKKLAGAAKTSFVKKCEADAGASATAACDAKATEKKLAGAARTSFVQKCESDAPSHDGGVRRQGGREEAGRRGQDELHQEVHG